MEQIQQGGQPVAGFELGERPSITWDEWLSGVWSALLAGQHITVPTDLPHPETTGFHTPRMALKVGQIADWVMSCPNDGSRVHLHEFADGRLVAHRDCTDPGRSPIHAMWHVATETPTGRRVAKMLARSALIGTGLAITGFRGAQIFKGTLAAGLAVEVFAWMWKR